MPPPQARHHNDSSSGLGQAAQDSDLAGLSAALSRPPAVCSFVTTSGCRQLCHDLRLSAALSRPQAVCGFVTTSGYLQLCHDLRLSAALSRPQAVCGFVTTSGLGHRRQRHIGAVYSFVTCQIRSMDEFRRLFSISLQVSNGLNHDLFCDKTSSQIKASVVIKYAEIIVKFNIIFNTIHVQDFASLGPLQSQHAKHRRLVLC